MVTTVDIRIRISSEQREQLKAIAERKGYRGISQYVRDKIFEEETDVTLMIKEIHQEICLQNAYKTYKRVSRRRSINKL